MMTAACSSDVAGFSTADIRRNAIPFGRKPGALYAISTEDIEQNGGRI
jgi:hypothetical protein